MVENNQDVHRITIGAKTSKHHTSKEQCSSKERLGGNAHHLYRGRGDDDRRRKVTLRSTGDFITALLPSNWTLRMSVMQHPSFARLGDKSGLEVPKHGLLK